MTETPNLEEPRAKMPWLKILGLIGVLFASTFAVALLQSIVLGNSFPLIALFQLGVAVWAAWDSAKIGVKRYRRYQAFIFAPASILIFAIFLWVLVIPAYIAVRCRIEAGLETELGEGEIPSTSQQRAKALRLFVFFVVCLVGGAGVLFCLFAPTINPSLVTGAIFRREPFKGEAARLIEMASKNEKAKIDTLEAATEHKLTAADFTKLGIGQPQDVTFNTADGETLHGWLFEEASAEDTVLLNWSGFGDMRVPVALGYVGMLEKAHLSVFLYDYRGMGESSGQAKLTTAIADGAGAYQYLTKEKKLLPNHLILMGRGIGAFVAARLARDNGCKDLILEDPWVTLKSWVDTTSPPMAMVPLSFYPEDGLNCESLLRDVHMPILIVSTSNRNTDPFTVLRHLRENESRKGQPNEVLAIDEFDTLILPDLSKSAARYTERVADLIAGKETTAGAKHALPSTPSEPAAITWLSDTSAALAQAKQDKKLVLADIYTDWCGWCKVMDRETYGDSAVRRLVDEKLVAVKVNAEDAKGGRKFAEKYQVMGFPTTLILNTDGEVVSRMEGFVVPARFAARLNEL